MKTLLTYLLHSVEINHAGNKYTYTRRGGTVEPTDQQIEEMPEPVALILILLSGACRIYLDKSAYFAIREKIWTLLDRSAGGLNAVGIEIYGSDEAVIEAAQAHREAIANSPKTKNGAK